MRVGVRLLGVGFGRVRTFEHGSERDTMTKRHQRTWGAAPASILSIGAAILLGSGPTNGTAYADDRYVAVLANGDRIGGDRIREWHEPKFQPKLDGKPLLDPKNPIRWLLDQSLAPAELPPARIEFAGGDVFPGTVIAAGKGADSPFDQPHDHLVVESPLPLDMPHHSHAGRRFRVLPKWVRRIVWQSQGNLALQPGTAFLKDGRAVAYRSLRWQSQGVRLLREQGTVEVAYGDLGELHLPALDPWECWFDQLAAVNGELDQAMIRLETSDGLAVTVADGREYLQANNHDDTAQWFVRLQPAWSLDVMWVRFRSIRLRRYHQPHRVPLTILDPVKVETRHALAHGWSVRSERNVRGGPLSGGRVAYGWGLGMQAYCRFEVPLPAAARALHGRVGLDDLVGPGGCAQAVVALVGPKDSQEIFRSPVLVGSEKTHDLGRIPLATGGKPGILALIADPVYENRPAGADPLDIRDCLDWFEPEIELDRAELSRAVQERVFGQIPAFAGWEVLDADPEPFAIVPRWDRTHLYPPSYRSEILPRQKLLTLTRTLTVDSARPWLALAVSRFEQNSSPSKIRVLADDKRIGEFDVPVRYGHLDPEPIQISLAPYADREIRLALEIPPAGQNAKLDWRAIRFVTSPIGLQRLFDEETDFPERLTQGEGDASYVREQSYAGTGSLQVLGGSKGAPAWPGVRYPIREQPRLGEYRYIRFAWRKDGGTRICLELGHEGLFGPRAGREKVTFRYEAGSGEESFGGARRLGSKLPSDWEVVTRDLYADFGGFDLTGLRFSTVDGEVACFDHIYLAREPHHFEKIEFKPEPRTVKLPPGDKESLERLRKRAEAYRLQRDKYHLAVGQLESARKYVRTNPDKAEAFLKQALELSEDDDIIKKSVDKIRKEMRELRDKKR